MSLENLPHKWDVCVPFYGIFAAIQNAKWLDDEVSKNSAEKRTDAVREKALGTGEQIALKVTIGFSAIPLVGTIIWPFALLALKIKQLFFTTIPKEESTDIPLNVTEAPAPQVEERPAITSEELVDWRDLLHFQPLLPPGLPIFSTQP